MELQHDSIRGENPSSGQDLIVEVHEFATLPVSCHVQPLLGQYGAFPGVRMRLAYVEHIFQQGFAAACDSKFDPEKIQLAYVIL